MRFSAITYLPWSEWAIISTIVRFTLMGLSNGGSAIVAAMHSSHAKDFKSLTSISCNLGGLRKVPCRINLIGGGQDHSSRLMPSQASRLSKMGVHGGLFFDS